MQETYEQQAQAEMWDDIARHTAQSVGTCTTCGQPARTPYERRLDGRLVEACMDESHRSSLDCRSAQYLAMWDVFHAKCAICKHNVGAEGHSLSCPTRWYRDA